MNIQSIIILSVIAVLFIAVIIHIATRKKKGKPVSCGGCCSSCGASCPYAMNSK